MMISALQQKPFGRINKNLGFPANWRVEGEIQFDVFF
jgi:hypothetical protein